MQKKILLLIFMAMFTVSCGTIQINPKEKSIEDVHKGFKGLEMEFIKGAPPENVYHNSEFQVVLRVWNRGAQHIKDRNAIMLLGVEEDYNEIKRAEVSGTGRDAGQVIECDNSISEDRKNQCSKIWFSLNGKTLINPRGEHTIATYNVKTKRIEPQSETRKSTLFAILCYPYKTEISASVCVDGDILGLRKSPKVCETKDIELEQGQGAPVTVAKVETRMLTEGEKVVPHFILHVENKGNGEVFRNDKAKEVCSSSSLNPAEKDFNTIFVTAHLGPKTEDNELDCSPKEDGKEDGKSDKGYVRLVGKKDIIRCQVKEKNAISKNIGAYTSPLIVTLDYGYTSTITKSYTIERGTI